MVGGAGGIPVERDRGARGVGFEVADGVGGYGVDPGVGGDECDVRLLLEDKGVGHAAVVARHVVGRPPAVALHIWELAAEAYFVSELVRVG